MIEETTGGTLLARDPAVMAEVEGEKITDSSVLTTGTGGITTGTSVLIGLRTEIGGGRGLANSVIGREAQGRAAGVAVGEEMRGSGLK